jgi:hypothetical protein
LLRAAAKPWPTCERPASHGLAAQDQARETVRRHPDCPFTRRGRIDDSVAVEKHWGRIEEITLTYVALGHWDITT